MSGNLQACVVELEALVPETPEGAEAAPDVFGLFKYITGLVTAIKGGDYMAIMKAVYDLLGQFVNQPPAPDGVSFALGGGLWLKLLPLLAKILAELAAAAPAA